MPDITSKNAVNENERAKLFITGLNIEHDKARYECGKGRLERLGIGVYLDALTPPVERREIILKNAARITMKLFPQGILAGSSAFHRGAVEGHLMIATPRGGAPVDVAGIFTIYNTKSDLDIGLNKEVEFITIDDSFGQHYIKRMSDELLIIKNFMLVKGRPRATYLNNLDLNKVVERCMRVTGGHDLFLRRIDALANAHGMFRYLRNVHAFIDNASSYTQLERPLESFRVFWHHAPVATLSHDGHIWNFEYDSNVQFQLSINEKKGRGSPPSFLGSLLPEVGIKAGKSMEENLGDFALGHRYISNITVKRSGVAIDKDIIIDMLDGELPDFRSEKLQFNGQLNGELVAVMNDDDLMNSLHRNPNSPRMSGMQIKIAGNLDRNGKLSSANGVPFTHILKIVGSNPKYQSMCSMEWFSLTIAKSCGINVEEYAIADLGGYGPSLVVERFDIRRDLNDKRMILAEDFWSIEGLTDNDQKYGGELMNVADTVMKKSTNVEVDSRHLLAQAIFSWLTWNGDLHLKNLLLIKESKNSNSNFDSIRLSPTYDVLCTQVFPEDLKSAAIGLEGSRNHSLSGFRSLGRKMGIKQEEVDAMVEYLAVSIPHWSRRIAKDLPGVISEHPLSLVHITKAQNLFELRCSMMIGELDNSTNKQETSKQNEIESFSARPLVPLEFCAVLKNTETQKIKSLAGTANDNKMSRRRIP